MRVAGSSRERSKIKEVKLSPEALLHLRSAGGDHKFFFAASDGITIRRLIVAMGVSLVVGSAARAAFERFIEQDLALREGLE